MRRPRFQEREASGVALLCDTLYMYMKLLYSTLSVSYFLDIVAVGLRGTELSCVDQGVEFTLNIRGYDVAQSFSDIILPRSARRKCCLVPFEDLYEHTDEERHKYQHRWW